MFADHCSRETFSSESNITNVTSVPSIKYVKEQRTVTTGTAGDVTESDNSVSEMDVLSVSTLRPADSHMPVLTYSTCLLLQLQFRVMYTSQHSSHSLVSAPVSFFWPPVPIFSPSDGWIHPEDVHHT
ncbi:hypothetical protein JOB18_025319 [Solea senegalensis]|uniref:Uncharacterized protein n=1 Tax=Solea senegalensis TaxID=28829 RepID=A0AAV6SZN3_SOLSE|nr:hypothetical protein JOB18_025319 [Solea senegalensis]